MTVTGTTAGQVNDLGAPDPPRNDPARILDAAKQFESLLISQMLKSMQDSQGGFMGSGQESDSAVMQYGQEAFAQAMSANGGLGLAHMVAQGLQKSDGQ